MGGAAPSGGLSDAHGGNWGRNGARPFCWGGAHAAPGSHPSPPTWIPFIPSLPPIDPLFSCSPSIPFPQSPFPAPQLWGRRGCWEPLWAGQAAPSISFMLGWGSPTESTTTPG